ncbi:hypothetical protein DLAC_11050 [Tieghemostelium lacteum]|uniref:Uncharacterized protein n=1 Tax=Tieghemostelium lacteum TaxID=361077 RepID=A0A151Z313_TIELA|nr:hypothetical protein DLAC_11050 [Tieghemostelium lacteum]|eukprot:KYQ88350.1 hypothetical protein DLAC_11050 [Tieghemostelium lacteum]
MDLLILDLDNERQLYRDFSNQILKELDIDNKNTGPSEKPIERSEASKSMSRDQNENRHTLENPISENEEEPVFLIDQFKPSKSLGGILPKFELPPMNITMDVTNSTMSLPLSIIADNLNISDVFLYSPNVELPLTFAAKNMTYNISIHSDTLPMALNLHPSNQSTIPISLIIQGSNSIPVNLQVESMQAPIINWVAFSLLGLFNLIFLGWLIFQQTTLNSLKKRLDAIDIGNQVMEGKRYKKGNIWYNSLPDKQQDNHHDNVIVDFKNLSNHTVICTYCGQVNGKTKFCFECGESLLNIPPPPTAVNSSSNNNNININS